MDKEEKIQEIENAEAEATVAVKAVMDEADALVDEMEAVDAQMEADVMAFIAEEPKNKKNIVVRILRYLAIAIYAFGVILGTFAFMQTMYQSGVLGGLVTALSTMVSYALYGSLVLGFSELLHQLERIANK